MSGLILTGWTGLEFAHIAANTLPIMADYAVTHGMDFACANLAGERPPSWIKVSAIHQALGDHELVVWIDADVVIVDPSQNIAADLQPGHVQALVEHRTNCGPVPNCGVWVATRELRPWLEEAWNGGTDIDHPWWEQATMMRLMGYRVELDSHGSPNATLDTPTTLHERTTWLHSRWNHHPRDERRVDPPAFYHVTQYADRIATVRHFCKSAGRAGRADP